MKKNKKKKEEKKEKKQIKEEQKEIKEEKKQIIESPETEKKKETNIIIEKKTLLNKQEPEPELSIEDQIKQIEQEEKEKKTFLKHKEENQRKILNHLKQTKKLQTIKEMKKEESIRPGEQPEIDIEVNEEEEEPQQQTSKFKTILNKIETKSSENSEISITNDQPINNNPLLFSTTLDSVPIKKNLTGNFENLVAEEKPTIKTVKTNKDRLLKAKRKILLMNQINDRVDISQDITEKAKELEKKIGEHLVKDKIENVADDNKEKKENVNVLLKSKIKSGSNKRKKRYEDFNDDE